MDNNAVQLGSICLFASLTLCVVAGLFTMDADRREELRQCTGEFGTAGLVFMIFAAIFEDHLGSYGECSFLLYRFAGGFLLVFFVLLVGCAIVNRRRGAAERDICRRLKRSALIYSAFSFVMALMLE